MSDADANTAVTSATLNFQDHDHTLGNTLRYQFLQNQNVVFTAYKVPHPLTKEVQVRVMCAEEDDVVQVTETAIDEILTQLTDFEQAFNKAVAANATE